MMHDVTTINAPKLSMGCMLCCTSITLSQGQSMWDTLRN